MATKTKINKLKTETSVKAAGAVGKSKTMEELLASTGYKLKGFRRGETVNGRVTEVSGKSVYIDIGGKAEAVISEKEYELNKDYFRALKPGDDIVGVVLIAENDAGQVILSLRRAAADSRWKIFEEALAEEKTLKAKGKEVTKGGLLVEIEGIVGFIPSSQLGRELEGSNTSVLGKDIFVKVIELDRQQNRLVLSEKAVSDSLVMEERRKALSGVQMGGEYEGTVVGMVPFGAFVEIEIGKGDKAQKLEGLVHISEVSWEKIDEVNKVMKEGDKVKVQVIGVDEETGKLALSMKRLSMDPWLVVGQKYKVDTKHSGVVSKIAAYGVLVRLEKGIEGLIHASKMPADKAFAEGEKVEVFVESVDLEKRRLSLGVVLSSKPVGYK